MTEKKQSKAESLVESVLKTACGFVVALLTWQFIVAPMWDIPVSIGQNLCITSIFTINSIALGYMWRRLFANGFAARVTNMLWRRRCA